MSTNITFTPLDILVIDQDDDGNQNVIKKIYWRIKFEKGGSVSTAEGVTLLNTDSITLFVEIDDLTDDMIFDMVKAESFGQSWDDFVASHDAIIDDRIESKSLTSYRRDSNFVNMDLLTPSEVDKMIESSGKNLNKDIGGV